MLIEMLVNAKLTMKCWLSCWGMLNRLRNVDCVRWLASTNGIRDGWPGYVWWLASANRIRDGWPGRIDDWLRLMTSEMDDRVCILWLAITNDTQYGWPIVYIVISYD